jgi:hypothetical protein
MNNVLLSKVVVKMGNLHMISLYLRKQHANANGNLRHICYCLNSLNMYLPCAKGLEIGNGGLCVR